MGVSTEEEYKKYLEKSKKNKPKHKDKPLSTPKPANIQDTKNYIILESKTHGPYSYPDILVSTGKDYHNQNWNQTQQTLHQSNEFMLTIRQYVDFLNLLKSGTVYDGIGNRIPSSNLSQILDEILTVREPWRSEWLDAKFTKQGRLYRITYHKVNPNGTSQEVTEPLEDCLMKEREPGIDLNHWLNKATPQGLPLKNTPKGDLWYWYPREDYVARFDADSGRAVLDCFGDPRSSYSSLGVRRAKIKV